VYQISAKSNHIWAM